MQYGVVFFPNPEKNGSEKVQLGIKKNSWSPSSLPRWKHPTDQIWSVDHQLERGKLEVSFLWVLKKELNKYL